MESKPIDRKNKTDLLKQFGRVEIEIRELDKKRSKIDKEIDMMPRKIEHLKGLKQRISEKVSKKKLYLNQLENDFKKL